MRQLRLRIDRPGGCAVFCSDTMHNPLQVLRPGVSTSSFLDRGLAATTRQTLLEEAVSTGRLIVPGHFRGARRAHARATGGSFARFFLSSRHRCWSEWRLTRIRIATATKPRVAWGEELLATQNVKGARPTGIKQDCATGGSKRLVKNRLRLIDLFLTSFSDDE